MSEGKIMKKLISIMLAVAIIALSCGLTVYGQSSQSSITKYPVIIVCGYAGPELVLEKEDGTEEMVWHIDNDDIIGAVLEKIPQILAGLTGAVLGQPDYLAKVVGEKMVEMLDIVSCNDDGSSKYNVKPMFSGPEETNSLKMLEKFGDERYQYEPDISANLREYIPRENMFNFYVDWRMGAVDCAKALDEYIQQVKEYCNTKKVNIFSISHGGQITGTYLSLFGYKKDVDNAVMTVPALRGAGIVKDLLGQDIHFDEESLIEFIEQGTRTEEDWHILLETQPLGFLDDVLNALVPYIAQVLGNIGSIWDFCPTEVYEQMKDKWLDPVKNAKIIEKSDYMHYTVMPSFFTNLQKCIDDYGMNISIIAGTDHGVITGSPINGDSIITTSSSTGAVCAPDGENFGSDYLGGGKTVSPAGTVDATNAYLKNNTWYLSGLYHGMMVWDDWCAELITKLVLTDEITSVYSSEKYPRFHYSTNPCFAIGMSFDKSAEGFLSSTDGNLVITNLSGKDYRLLPVYLRCKGINLRFRFPPFTVLKAGDSISIPFTGTIPEGNTIFSIKAVYCDVGSMTPVGERTLSFTAVNK